MKLSQRAKEQGLSEQGAWRMWKTGQFPVPAEPLPTGTLLIQEIKPGWDAVGLYARVSSSEQSKEMPAQLGRLLVYAPRQGWMVRDAVGSGLNGERPKLEP